MQHYQHWQKQRSLKAWLKYLQICRVKRWQNEMAVQFHRATVLQIHFCDWQWAWEWRQSLSAHQALVVKLAGRMVLRRAFTHWKHYMLLQAEEAAQREAAAEHRQHYLLYSCFRAFKDNVTQARLQQTRKKLAQQLRDTTLLHRFWNLWQSRIEQREERVQTPSLHAALSHYRVTVLHKCVRVWLRYVHKRQWQQLLRARADGHFQQRALPAAFYTWYRGWLWHQQRRILHTKAVRFHRGTLEKQVFALWRQKMSQHRENCLAERMAILQAEQQLLRRFWFVWHQQAAVCQLERQQQAMAIAHHHSGLLRRAFCIWKESTQGFRIERMGRAQAAHFHSAQLLSRAWSMWREVYQNRVRSVLREVAARERQHNRQLLWWALHLWRENTMARLDGAKKTSQARVHYSRTLCSKVLVQWREVTSVQIYYRQKEAAALREARKALDRGRLQNWFQHWRFCSQRAAQQRFQLGQAAQHHHWQLLMEAMARWKAHHLGCIRKKFLQRQAAQLLAQRLSRACFCQWRKQLAVRKQEQWGTARALWLWAFSLQAKVWTAWLGFVLERRRKKARLERAMQAYQQQLLQEGATRLLRFTAGTKAFRQQLQAQQQVQAAHSLHCAVRHCAELWKKKVLGPGKTSQPPAPTTFSKRVTFKDSFLSGHAAEAGDATQETKKLRAPPSQGVLGSLAGAAGEPCHLDLNAARSSRKQPRRPSFLLERLGSQRSPEWYSLGEQQLEKPPEEESTALLGGSSLTRPFLPGVLPNVPGPKLPPTASPGLELLPPSSIMPHAAGGTARVSAKPSIPGPQPWGCPSLPRDLDPQLLPGDSISTRTEPVYGSEATGHTELEAELEGIQQQLQHYQTTKQNLWSCQRQANSLRRWLELSQEEPKSEDLHLEEQVKTELEEVRPGQPRASPWLSFLSACLVPPSRPCPQVELQVQQLAKELEAQRQPVGTCIARVRALRRALC